MSESDDDEIICISESPSKSRQWPTEAEIDDIVRRMVQNHVDQGQDASTLKLKTVLKRFSNCGFTGDFMVSFFL